MPLSASKRADSTDQLGFTLCVILYMSLPFPFHCCGSTAACEPMAASPIAVDDRTIDRREVSVLGGTLNFSCKSPKMLPCLPSKVRFSRLASSHFRRRNDCYCAGSQPVPLTPKAFDLLVALIRRSGHLVTKDDLLREVWPGTFVEEVNLTVHISGLRKALDRGGTGSAMIETVPTRGYRFVAPVSTGPKSLYAGRVF